MFNKLMETLEYIASVIVRTFIPAVYVAKYLCIVRIYIGRFKLSLNLKFLIKCDY